VSTLRSPNQDQATRLRALVDALAETGPGRAATPGAPEGGAQRAAPAGPLLLTIASGKGGVGKTSIAVNLAIALTRLRRRVVLVDADLGVANADLLCGLTPAHRTDRVLDRGLGPGVPSAGGDAWLRRAPTLRDIAIDAPGGFRLVPGAVGLGSMADLDPPRRALLVEQLRGFDDADVVIADAAAGIGGLVTAFTAAADSTLVVATPEPTSIADAYALIKCAASMSGWHAPADRPPRGGLPTFGRVGLVVNQAAGAREATAVHARIDAVARRFLGLAVPLAGWVAHDPRVGEAVRARVPYLLRGGGVDSGVGPAGGAAAGLSALAQTVAPSEGRNADGGLPVAAVARERRWWSILRG
jgi:flagellar biosynthesis protein FlhG